jgi:hypothetical protein
VNNVFYFPFFHLNATFNYFAAAVLLRVVPGLVNATQSQQPQRKQEKKRKVRVQNAAPTLGVLQFFYFLEFFFKWNSKGE